MLKTCKNYDFCTQLKEGIDASKFHPPQGYNPLEVIRQASALWVPVPFNGIPIWVKLRCLNQTQFMAVNDLTCIDTRTEKEKKKIKVDLGELINIYNKQEALVEASLITPTFKEIIEILTTDDIIKKKKEYEEIKKLFEKADRKDPNYKKLKKKYDALELFLGFLLPNDFMGFITSWAQGVDITNVKKLSRKMLLEAAILARNGNNNPSDHISGVYTDFHKNDINKAAWATLKQYDEDKKSEQRLKKNNYKWIGKKPR